MDFDEVVRMKINNENNEDKKLILYIEFMLYQWNKIDNDLADYLNRNDSLVKRFYELFPMLPQGMTLEREAKYLIEWLNTHNNGKLPDNLQIMFNEFLLERI